MVAVSRRIKIVIASLAIVIVIALVVFVFFLPDFPMLYGIKEVAEINGHKIYLKRASSSIFDDRSSLSLDGDRCQYPDDEDDYRLRSQDANAFPVYFKIAGAQLTVYEALDQPTADPWPFAVIQHPLDVKEFGTMQNAMPPEVFKAQVTGQDLTECHFSLKYFPKRH
jgi:hypothetical protein